MIDLHTAFAEAKTTGAPLTLTPEQLALLFTGTDVLDRLASAASQQASGLLMSPEEVCKELRVNRQTLWRMRKAGRFIEPIYVTARKFLFRREDFNAWVASRPAA